VFINSDFATAIGHSVRLKFKVSDEESKEEEYYQELLAIPTYDGHQIDCVEDLIMNVEKIRDSKVTVWNDFDIPWIQ
jgi:hypothetical protein